MNTRSPYSQDEVRFIEINWKTMTDREIADALSRTELGIGTQRVKMSLLRAKVGAKPGGVRPWTKEEDDMLRFLYDSGTDAELGVMLDRTPGAVAQRRSSLRLLKKPAPNTRRVHPLWLEQQDDLLTQLFHQGLSDSQIGESLGKTACSIKDRRQSLGLNRSKRS